MQLIALLLSSLLGFLSPIGFVVDRVAQNAIRSRFQKVEELAVRVDNPPSQQLIQGKVERVRIAGRGLWLTPDFRIAALEVETDPLEVDIQRLRQPSQNQQQMPVESLRRPVQAGMRLVLNEDDLNKLLRSPAVIARMRNISSRFLGTMGGQQEKAYELVNPNVEFLADNRLRFQVSIQEKMEAGSEQTNPRQLTLRVESGLGISSGNQVQLVSPTAFIDDRPVHPFLLNPLVSKINERLDLRKLEPSGITARLLQLNLKPKQMEMAMFVRVEPKNK